MEGEGRLSRRRRRRASLLAVAGQGRAGLGRAAAFCEINGSAAPPGPPPLAAAAVVVPQARQARGRAVSGQQQPPEMRGKRQAAGCRARRAGLFQRKGRRVIP